MHCEKHFCENVMKTIFDTKDISIVQKDLKDCGMWPHLWLQEVASWFIKPTATHVLTYEEKERFVCIVRIKTPAKYVSSLKKRIRDGDLKGMKSHDYHIMMQEILLLCM
jgi:hypothetical protein